MMTEVSKLVARAEATLFALTAARLPRGKPVGTRVSRSKYGLPLQLERAVRRLQRRRQGVQDGVLRGACNASGVPCGALPPQRSPSRTLK
jgi:hypothetical protein